MKHLIILFSVFFLTCYQPLPSAANAADVSDTVVDVTDNITEFKFKDWKGPKLPVYIFKPTGVDLTQAPILMMMHGNGRGAKRYLKQWAPMAQEKGIIVVAPLFTKDDFPRSRGYNLGNIHKSSGKPNKESKWSFSAIEPIFDEVVSRVGSQQKSYTLYGHSAGSQFVHRFLYYKPDARVKRYLAANAGWYTLPNIEDYPYGLKGLFSDPVM